jgi:hypothetical protein
MSCKVIFACANLITILAGILGREMHGFQVVGGVLKLVADFPTQIARY